jgi:hypothetical protein
MVSSGNWPAAPATPGSGENVILALMMSRDDPHIQDLKAGFFSRQPPFAL